MAYNNQTLGRGEVHFSRFKDGTQVPEGFRYLGNTPEFNLSISTDNLDHFSSDRGIKEKDQSIPLQTNRTGSMTCDDIQLENVAYFFFGATSTLSQTSATAVAEAIVDVIPGRSYQVGQTTLNPTGVRRLTNFVLKVGATTKNLNTDYTIDLERGILTIVEGGSIINGDDVALTYDRAAVSRKQMLSGTQPVSGALRFISYNPQGDKFDYYMPYVKLSPNGDYALKSDDWQTIPFNVDIQKPTVGEAIYVDGQPFVP